MTFLYQTGQNRRGPKIALLAAFIVVLSACPFVMSNYWLRLATGIMMYAVVAQGLNIIVGFAGYHAFGNSLFFGVGAYSTGTCMAMGLGFGPSLVLTIPVAALTAVIFGWPILRLSGHYFAIATVGLNMALLELVNNIKGVTGGAMGLPLPISPMEPDAFYTMIYFLMFAVLIGATGTVWWLDRSPVGFAIKAGRDSESGAQVMGINTTAMKISAWVMSGVFTALAGGIWAYWFTYIDPGSAFDINISIKGYVMMLLGGMGTISGPIIGAIFLELLATLVWGNFLEVHLLILGILIVASVLLLPEGLIQIVDQVKGAYKERNATP